jgi:mono/diheme cytochrome c family protein
MSFARSAAFVAITLCLLRNGLAKDSAAVDFGRDVQPILQTHCVECHGPKKQKNGFRLDRRSDAFKGGTAAMIGRGNADASRLYLRLTGAGIDTQMPPDGPLNAEQIGIIKRWIDQGADWTDALSG